MRHLQSILVAAVFASLPVAAGCEDVGVSPEEVCAHGEHFAADEAAQHGASAEAVRKTRDEAHRACVDAESQTQKGTDRGHWGKYSRCMVGKKTRAEQAECREHVR
jgi:hypothetical protein